MANTKRNIPALLLSFSFFVCFIITLFSDSCNGKLYWASNKKLFLCYLCCPVHCLLFLFIFHVNFSSKILKFSSPLPSLNWFIFNSTLHFHRLIFSEIKCARYHSTTSCRVFLHHIYNFYNWERQFSSGGKKNGNWSLTEHQSMHRENKCNG